VLLELGDRGEAENQAALIKDLGSERAVDEPV